MKITYKQAIDDKERTSDDEILKTILKNRKIDDVQVFLHPPSPLTIELSSFGYDKEITTTLEILEKIKKEEKMIVVYTDYDADGITGGSILWETLYLLGFKVMPYVPHRQLEGYGFSIKGIDNVKNDYDPALIISVDHGIAAPDQIAYAKSIGIPVIVTDHHVKGDVLPKAEAIFHIPALSGSGVSYFFSKMVFDHFKKDTKNLKILTDNFQNDYIALASIGTIADLVPLVGPSRSIVSYGLKACTNTKRVGLCHILKEAGIEGKTITPYEVGFVIAPRINAIGRLEHAMDALRLLCTPKAETALALAGKVGATNTQRQELVKKAVETAIAKVESEPLPKVITLVSDEWHEGIIGLIASRLTEKYYRPSIIMTKGEGFYKGSARSIPAFHMTNFLKELKGHLLNVGGHAQAAGFSIQEDKIELFTKELHSKAHGLIQEKDLERVVETDLKIPLSKITFNLARKLETLQPFGIGNPQPLFYSEAKILDAKLFGKKSEYLKLIVQDANTYSFPLEMISFSLAEKYSELSRNKVVNLVYTIEVDRWGGNEKLKGKIVSID